MKSTLLQAWLSLLLLAMVAGAVQSQPRTSLRQTSRQAIVARAERNRRMAAVRSRLDTGSGLQPRQATTSCGAYKTCTESSRSGSNYCTLKTYDIYLKADTSGIQTYSLEECVKGCEAKSGCVAAFWRPGESTVESNTINNCLFKSNSWTGSDLKKTPGASWTTVLLGKCCDFDARLPASVKADACHDDGQKFQFPTCTGSRRAFTGSATYQGVDLWSYASTKAYRQIFASGADWLRGKATMTWLPGPTPNLPNCLAACETMGDDCKGVKWKQSSAVSSWACFFSGSKYTSAPHGSDGSVTNGYRNDTEYDFHVINTDCRTQVGKVPDILSFYCCDDPVKAYPVCPNSLRDGSAYYKGYDDYQNDLLGYGDPDYPIKKTVASSQKDCNSKCFNDIRADCIGVTWTGPSTSDNCFFKVFTNSTSMINRRYANGGTALIGACSQYSTAVGSAADSVCCNNF